MGKSKEMFNEEREKQLSTDTLALFIDDEYQVYEYNNQQSILRELFTSWTNVFGK